jgi:hypothetical protein
MSFRQSKRAGLGDEFLGEYWSAIERITLQPLAHGVAHAGRQNSPDRKIAASSPRGPMATEVRREHRLGSSSADVVMTAAERWYREIESYALETSIPSELDRFGTAHYTQMI